MPKQQHRSTTPRPAKGQSRSKPSVKRQGRRLKPKKNVSLQDAFAAAELALLLAALFKQ
jgi:hypothetical protein